ncbi:hypothetical protein JK222_14545 [Gluconobacter cerinus]|uniref:hypothetical protein n=1 Tax=Gluconobacter cerinus TaxID=38307 RepID=UPI001B8CC2F1|nr:hypothetical protein [Gluconobacter cerinus]MBS1072905.1 hypothetical protein [Gluconobacter cerinus]
MQFQAFIRRIWERTGYSPGDDAAWIAAEADIASLSAQTASGKADQALRAANDAQGLAALHCSQAVLAKAQDALDAATMALLQAQAYETRALKALENA